ncbi:MAG: carboxypeptidase regulatory-like domain-containing protein [Verrucomicrobiae bacterium]|nr:carboxypeptidase regulatory-like domain-containing protein [Verrucomicrobiae bacterium]
MPSPLEKNNTLPPLRNLSHIFAAVLLVLVGSSARADSSAVPTLVDITRPGDTIVAISDGFSSSPPGEGVENAIDNDPNTKYLNTDYTGEPGFEITLFSETPSSTISPGEYYSLITGIRLTSANDAPNRDPASVKIEGLDRDTQWITIVDNLAVPEFTARFQTQTLTFANTATYSKYRVRFTAKPIESCCVQIAEVELLGSTKEPACWIGFSDPSALGVPYSLYDGRAIGSGFTSVSGAGYDGDLAVQVDPGDYLLSFSHYTTTDTINEFTLLMDIKYAPPTGNEWIALFQTNPDNTDDADLWINANGKAIGTYDGSAVTSGQVEPDTWYRCVVSVKNGSYFRIFIDGELRLDLPGYPVNGRYSWSGSNYLALFRDNDGEDQRITASEIAFWDYSLTNEQITALGDVTFSPARACRMLGVRDWPVNIEWRARGANLRECDLRYTQTLGSYFDDGTLRCATLAGATLTNATFHNTDLVGTDFTGATGFTLGGANTTNAIILNTTDQNGTLNSGIAWSDPVMTYGTALSAQHLNATVDSRLTGTFSYNPPLGTVLPASQEITATFTLAGTNISATRSVFAIVNPAPTVITWNPGALAYGEPLTSAHLNASTASPGEFFYDQSIGQVLDAGTHVLRVNFVPDDAQQYDYASKEVTVTVAQVPLTITADNKQRAAGVANPPLTASYAGWVNGDTALSSPPSLSTSATSASAPGTYPIVVTGGSDPNYAITRVNGILTIAAKEVPVFTWSNPSSIIYGTALSSAQLNASANVAGSFSYTPASGTVLNAGNGQSLTANFTPTDTARYASASKVVMIDVVKATPVITWNAPPAVTYGTALGNNQLNATVNAPGTLAYSPTTGTVLNAGAGQQLQVTFTPSDGNYNGASKAVAFTVNQAPLTITADNKQRGAGLPNPPLTASYAGFVNSDTALATPPTLATTATQSSNPGIYPITVTGGSDPNYSITRAAGVFTIAEKEVPVLTWNAPAPITYGTALGATQLNATASVAGSFNYSPSTGAVLDAGNHTLTVTFTPNDAARYASASETVSITVSKATPVINWSTPAAIVYGTPLGGTQLSAATSAPGTLAYSPAAGTVLGAGTSQLVATFTPANGNYNGASKAVNITINQAPLTITADDKQRGAGLSNPPLTASYAGFVNGDTALATPPSLSTQATTASAPGTYPIVVTGGSDPNYAITRVNGSLTISAKEVPVLTWNAPSPITYGTALSATQLSAVANVPGSISYSPASGSVLDAGNGQTLTASFTPTDTTRYATASKAVSIDVSKATPVITWSNPEPIVYGTQLGGNQLTATVDAPGTLAYVPAAGTVLNAGAGQQLQVSFTPSNNNYKSGNKTVAITVNKALLTITADNKQRGAGLPNPPLTASYSGFVNGDTATDLDTPVSLTSTAAQNSAPGDYTIEVLGGSSANYDITRINAKLTITAKEVPVLAWNNPAAITYGTALGNAQLNASANTPGSFTYNPPGGTVLNAGTGQSLSVTFVPTDSARYANATRTVAINVNKATPTIAWNQPTAITYGTALGSSQLSATVDAPGTLAYVPAAGTVLNAGNLQELRVTFTPSDGNHEGATETVILSVNKAPLTIRADDKQRRQGQSNPPLTASYIGFVNGDTAAVLSPPASLGTTATTASAAGDYPITVSGGASPNYSITRINGTLAVSTKAVPVLTWNSPAPITYGTALGAAQLNATASTPGTFVYDPPTATILNAGTSQTLSVSFTPSDSVNFAPASRTVTLTVNRAPLLITANDASRKAGEPNPTFAATYNGFVNGDSSFLLDIPVSFSTPASQDSPQGDYPIIPGGASDVNYSITFIPGTLTVTEGDSSPTELTGFIWLDRDGNGLRSADADSVIPDAQVLVYNAAGTRLLGAAVTDANGRYRISGPGVTPGSYILALTIPSENGERILWVATQQNVGNNDTIDSDLEPCNLVAGICLTQSILLTDGTSQWDAGLVQQDFDRGAVTGLFWWDANRDGILQNESGIKGATVELLSAGGRRLRSTVTDALGNYQFLNVLPGSYRVRFVAPEAVEFSPQVGSSQVFPADGTSATMTLNLGKTLQVIAGGAPIEPETAQLVAERTGELRKPKDTAQALRLHRDEDTGALTLRWTVLPQIRTAGGAHYFPAQRVESSRDLIHWQDTGIGLPATAVGSIGEERIPVIADDHPTYLRIRVETSPSDFQDSNR